MIAGGANRERVAVGCRFGDDVCTDSAARAGFVLDNHLLLEFVTEFCGEITRKNIGGTAGREAEHDFDRLGRPRLRRYNACWRHHHQHIGDGEQHSQLM